MLCEFKETQICLLKRYILIGEPVTLTEYIAHVLYVDTTLNKANEKCKTAYSSGMRVYCSIQCSSFCLFFLNTHFKCTQKKSMPSV